MNASQIMQPAESNSDRLRQIISLIDLTNLNDDCDSAAIQTLCSQADTVGGPVAALCIWPSFIKDAKETLGADSTVKIATVVNFPSGNEPIQSTCNSIEKALSDGADEIDYVLPYTQLINSNINQVTQALQTVRKCIPDHALLKVILETGVLGSSDLIRIAAETAIEQGANFIKTSTGKVDINATPKAAEVMLEAIADSQHNVGFKAAGGIRTVEDANAYLKLAENIFGTDWVIANHFRFGASGLLQDVLSHMSDDSVTPTISNSDY